MFTESKRKYREIKQLCSLTTIDMTKVDEYFKNTQPTKHIESETEAQSFVLKRIKQ